MLYSNIIKIKTKNNSSFGTGIIVAKKQVLTAKHVIRDEDFAVIEYNNQEYNGKVVKKDDNIVILEIEKSEFSDSYKELVFTLEEILDRNTIWESQGYYSKELIRHLINGKGIFAGKDYYTLSNIESGKLNNYEGLSGSPVICNERAIGILQIQSWDNRAELELKFTYVNSFKNLLPPESLKPTKYIEDLYNYCQQICKTEITKNIISRKYIKEIYVEEDEYKDNLRIFADPVLFINKIIEELNSINFDNINNYLKKQKATYDKIDFSKYTKTVPNNLEENYKSISEELNRILKLFENKDLSPKKIQNQCLEDYFSQTTLYNSSLKYKLEAIFSHLKYISFKTLLLTNNAGQGKTNFLCDFTENFLIKKHFLALYFNASDFIEYPYDTIIKKLTLDKQKEEKYINEALKKNFENTGRPVVIVIDGLNENTTLNNFGKHIEKTIKDLSKMHYIKIIATTRNELLYERFSNLNENILGEDFLLVDMKKNSHNKQFKERIINGYLKYFDVVLQDYFEETYNQISDDVLLLRFFCEAYQKKQVYLYDIYKYDLFQKYYEQKQQEMELVFPGNGSIIFDNIISKIARKMFSDEKFNKIPKNYFQIDEIQLINKLLESDIVFKEDIEVVSGLIKEKTETVSFLFDEFRDYCLTKYMIRQKDAEKTYPVLWEKMHLQKWSITEGVEKYSFFLAKTICPNILPIINQEKYYSDIYWNNIWNIEEKYINDNDIVNFKNEFINEEKHRYNITVYLLNRNNKLFYKKVNIDLFFEILDEISDKPSIFYNFLNTFFQPTQKDRFGMIINSGNCVYECDKLIDDLYKNISKYNTDKFKDFLKLTLYLYEIMPRQIETLWMEIYNINEEIVLEILRKYEYKSHIGLFIKQNLCN